MRTVRFILFVQILFFLMSVFGGELQAGEGPYFSIREASEQKNFEFRWDPLLKNATVRGVGGTIKFHVGSEYILNKGTIVRLEDKIRFLAGDAAAPFSAKAWLDGLTRPAPAAPAETQTLPAGGYRIRRVVIDPGHGGRDYGATSPRGAHEKDLVLEVAREVRDALRAKGVEVRMTRDSDEFISLSQRAKLTNDWNADFFVSIHANASPTRSLRGFETYFLSEATDDESLALQRAENAPWSFGVPAGNFGQTTRTLKTIYWDLRETENRRESVRMAESVTDAVRSSVVVSNQRLLSANFYVLRWTECPAVLIELGYLTNRADERKLRSPLYRQRLARAVASGLLSFKRQFETTDGFTKS